MNPLRPEGHTPSESPGIVKAHDSLSVVYCRLVIVWGRRGRCASGTGLAVIVALDENCRLTTVADVIALGDVIVASKVDAEEHQRIRDVV